MVELTIGMARAEDKLWRAPVACDADDHAVDCPMSLDLHPTPAASGLISAINPLRHYPFDDRKMRQHNRARDARRPSVR
jgi:hypothetical protein